MLKKNVSCIELTSENQRWLWHFSSIACLHHEVPLERLRPMRSNTELPRSSRTRHGCTWRSDPRTGVALGTVLRGGGNLRTRFPSSGSWAPSSWDLQRRSVCRMHLKITQQTESRGALHCPSLGWSHSWEKLPHIHTQKWKVDPHSKDRGTEEPPSQLRRGVAKPQKKTCDGND